ncbi:unnamed protein product [Adineta steineri]|uniref:Caspase family p20 domain-containing protein n=1 Tax=Adineta steineri TaxID=433720 RepID=A0A814PBX0_9BILA|nr:unnamed protein product [Adineta steineri]
MATSTSTVLRFQRKVALLIGNQNYCRSEDQLRHTINDVDDISIALRNMKFHVKTEHDLYNSEMICAFSDFSNIIIDGDLILFYFSGHGCEINGRNYLLPIDDELIENDKVKRERNDSHPMELPAGTYVVFACSPYQIASDGLLTERNGLFAKHLLKHMTKPNKDIKQLFRTVTNGVCIESKQKQKPTRIDGLIGLEQIYLNDKSIHINNGNKKTKYKGSSVLQ